MRMRLRLVAAVVLSALLAAGGTSRAQQQPEADTLTSEERREAGEFLLRLDRRWHEARDFSTLFDEAFVGDFVEVAQTKSAALPFMVLDETLSEQLAAADWRRAHVAGLDFMYVAGRVTLAFELREKNRKAAQRAEAASRPPVGGGEPPREGGEDAEPSLEELLSPAVTEVFKSNPLLAAALSADSGGGDEDRGDGEGLKIKTREQLVELLTTLEHATLKMRARARELEAELPGPPLSAVPREDEDEGELPELQLTTLEKEWRNRPAGTRLICGYVSILHVDLVKEGGRYRVLAAYVKD